MTKTTEAARKLAQELKCRNDLGESWRKIARSYNSPKIKPGTLCSWVNGAKDLPREYLEPLGLVKARKPEPEHTRRVKRKIAGMAKETREAVIRKG